jgi:hypothetical protein
MGVGLEYYLPSIETAGNCTGYRPSLNDAEQVQRHSITCTGGLSWVDNNKRNDYLGPFSWVTFFRRDTYLTVGFI